MSTPVLERGWVDSELAEEFPHLALRQLIVPARPGRSPQVVKERLRTMSDRFTGGHAVNLRQQPIPWSYRVFFRQIGIDPDDQRTPVEALALERMFHGGFKSQGLPRDAVVIATMETGVALMALDADRVSGTLGVRLSRDGERLGREGRLLRAHQMVVADESGTVAMLFGDCAPEREVATGTRRVLLAAVQVKGVPEVSVEEAMWTAVETLQGADAGAS